MGILKVMHLKVDIQVKPRHRRTSLLHHLRLVVTIPLPITRHTSNLHTLAPLHKGNKIIMAPQVKNINSNHRTVLLHKDIKGTEPPHNSTNTDSSSNSHLRQAMEVPRHHSSHPMGSSLNMDNNHLETSHNRNMVISRESTTHPTKVDSMVTTKEVHHRLLLWEATQIILNKATEVNREDGKPMEIRSSTKVANGIYLGCL
jgi:hypothetical protein